MAPYYGGANAKYSNMYGNRDFNQAETPKLETHAYLIGMKL